MVLDVRGLQCASEQNVVAARSAGGLASCRSRSNPVAQSATVTYDPALASVAELRRWVIECGHHCAGQSVPSHVCDPMAEPDPPAYDHAGHPGHEAMAAQDHAGHTGMTAVLP